MIRHILFSAVLAVSAGLAVSASLAWHPAAAQGLEPGAMAGGSYLPSTHTKGCSGLLCDSDDPRRQAVTATGAPAPLPACQGLLCSMTPYSMGRPVTAAEAQRTQEQGARPAAVVAQEPAKPKRSARRKKVKAAKTVAARTPDPTPAAAEAPR